MKLILALVFGFSAALSPLYAHEAERGFVSAVGPVAGSFNFWGTVPLEGSGAGPVVALPLLEALPAAVNSAGGGAHSAPSEPIVAVELQPETVRLRAYDEPLSARIEVSGSETSADIATGSVRLSKIDRKAISPPVFIDPKAPVSLGDENNNGVSELRVRFPREGVNALLPGNAEARVSVAGAFRSGATFEAEDTIRTVGESLKGSEPVEEQGFSLAAAYAFPTPAKGVNPTIRLQTHGRADSVEITILNRFQETVHRATYGPPFRIDGRWTSDYSWNVSGARTGIYIFRVTARRAGYPEISAVGRMAVIR